MPIIRRGGRPPRKKTERLNISMTEQEYLACQKAAEIMEVSMSEVVREGVRRVIRHLKQKNRWNGPDAGGEQDDVD